MTTQHSGSFIPEFTLGDRLRKARESTGLTVRQFAEQIGVSHGTIWAFPSPTRASHLTANHVGLLISRALPQGWTAHSLRRRFATTVYAGSHDIRAVQQLLGHSSVQTTQVYVGVDRTALWAAVRHAA